MYLSMYPSIYLPTYLSIYLPTYLSTYLSKSISISISISTTVYNLSGFFDVSPSKSCLKPTYFSHFDLEMCFAPQCRALFHFSSGQVALHPPLWRGYFSLPTHKSLEKHSVSRLSNISRTCILFLLALSLSLFYSSLFYSSLFYSSLFYSSLTLLLFSSL